MLNDFFFRKSCRCGVMWKNIVEGRQTIDDNMAHANCMLDT